MRLFAVTLVFAFAACNRPPIKEEFKEDWRSTRSGEDIVIGRSIVSSKMSNCAEYYIKKSTEDPDRYLLACTPDLENWSFYMVSITKETCTPVTDSSINAPIIK
jgi:hypothetical protein